MATDGKQFEGCRTCQSRHQQCNPTQSPCPNCQLPHITCHAGDPRLHRTDRPANKTNKRAAQVLEDEVQRNAGLEKKRAISLSPDPDVVFITENEFRNGRASGLAFKSSATVVADAGSTAYGEEETSSGSVSAPSVKSMIAGSHPKTSAGPSKTSTGPSRTSTGTLGTSPGPSGTRTEPSKSSTGPSKSSTGPSKPSTGPSGTSTEPSKPSTGPLWTSIRPLWTSTGPLGTSIGPSGTSTGPLGTSTGPLGTSTGPLGTSTGPLGTSTGLLGTSTGPLGTSTGLSKPSTGSLRTATSVAAVLDQPSNATAISNDPASLPLPNLGATSLDHGKGAELGFMMIYLDYVFPFLFPFYRPLLQETGRHWLLSLLCQNEVSYHTAARLSSYFFSVVLQDGGQDVEDSCKALAWRNLMEQMKVADMKIQQDVEDIHRPDVQATLMESTHVMAEIVQFVVVEVTVLRNAAWANRLSHALTVFEDMFKYHGTLSFQPNLDHLLKQMYPSCVPMRMALTNPLPNTADQSALLFFIAILLFIDVISSTALGQAPRLQRYHPHLLSSHPEAGPPVSLDAFVGCPNWVLLAISDISAMSAWKEKAKRDGTLSIFELVNYAQPICQALEKGFTGLNATTTSLQPMVSAAGRLDGYYARLEGKTSIKIVTQVWAHAARIYLSVVLSGWQPGCSDVQTNVTKVLGLLQFLTGSPAQLRSLAWPLCVAGCLALPPQEQKFCRIIASMGELCDFGTISEAKAILEAVWKSRDTLDQDTWNIDACLRILGSPTLLV